MHATYEEVMAAHRNTTWASIKHDGYRVQIHRSPKKFWMFTKNGNQLNYACYPDLVSIVEKLPVCIIDAEMVTEGASHGEIYENVRSRFRKPNLKPETLEKYLKSGLIQSAPMHLKVFDTLRFGNIHLLNRNLVDRTTYTNAFDTKGVIPVENKLVQSTEELEALVEATFASKKEEGVVCKNPFSSYRSGEHMDWVKFKRGETLDLAVVGIYKSEKMDLPFVTVLCAAYNHETGMYETLGKIAVVRNNFARDIHAEIGNSLQPTPPPNLALSDKLQRASYAKHLPDAYIAPENSVVLEVSALNLTRAKNWQTCGAEDGEAFSMRIGYVKYLRHDKDPEHATKTSTIRKLYELQQEGPR
jgi:ATP-dependent DNA ligase